MANNLFNAIRVVHKSPTAVLDLLVGSYEKDYGTFATGNNRGPLNEAVKILTASKLDKALALAVTKGYDAGGLTTGYIGSVAGRYSVQPADVQKKYNEAIERATAAFRVALTDSGLFAEKTEATKEEKERERSEREEKKAKKEAEAKTAILHAAVVSGEIVMAKDIHPVPDTHEMVTTVCNSIIAGLLTDEELKILRVALSTVAPAAPVADTVTVTA